MLTAREIEMRQYELTDEASRLADERARLSLDVVAGDASASARRDEIDDRVRAIRAECVTLKEAAATLRKKERVEQERAEEAKRHDHMIGAASQARELVRLAGKVDKAVADFRALLKDLERAEREVRNEMLAAGRSPDSHVIGRSGIKGTAITRMKIMLEGGDQFVNSRPSDVHHIASVGWRELIEWGDEHDVI